MNRYGVDWGPEDEELKSVWPGEVRGIPLNKTTDSERAPEEQELFRKIINSMRERGRQALKE